MRRATGDFRVSSLGVSIATDRERTGPELVFLGGVFEETDYALLLRRAWTGPATGRCLCSAGRAT